MILLLQIWKDIEYQLFLLEDNETSRIKVNDLLTTQGFKFIKEEEKIEEYLSKFLIYQSWCISPYDLDPETYKIMKDTVSGTFDHDIYYVIFSIPNEFDYPLKLNPI